MTPVEVELDGQPATADLLELRVSGVLDQPTQCEITLRGREPVDPGTTLTVRATEEMFTGSVTAVQLVYTPDGQALLRIRAYDRLHELRRREPLRVFENVTVADLARQLAGKVDAEHQGPTLERLVQHGQNDLALLTENARRAGLHLVMDGDTVRLITMRGYGKPVPLMLGTTLLEATFEANVDRLLSEVTAFGWHTETAEVYTERASDDQPHGIEGVLTDQPGRSQDELHDVAQARLDASIAASATVRGVSSGNAALRPGCRIDVSGVASRFEGEYVLTEVVHTVDAAGFQTAFSSAPPTRRAEPTTSTLTLGRVTNVDDPLARGRVQVTLPALGELDGGWFPVLVQAAGPDKQIVTLPDVDDTVLVALPNGVAAHGIVLGALFGQSTPADSGVVGGRVKRWTMRTPGGQSVVLDDDRHLLRIENEAGSFVELGPAEARLHATTDLVIQAPGKAITIRANTVDFVRAEASE